MRLVLFLLLPTLAVAAPPSLAKRAGRRAEASRAISMIAAGEQVEANLSRLRYLGEERFAFGRLSTAFDQTFDDRVRRDIALALGALSRPGDEWTLLRLLEDDDSAVRMHGLKGLHRARAKNDAAIVPLLEDKSSGVRREAARVLGAMKKKALGAKLLKAAKVEGEPEVRAELLVAVGDSGDPKQIPGLQAFFESSSESARFAAARGLCRLGAPSGLAYADKLLRSADVYEREQGLALFEGVSAKISGPHLRPLLDGEDRALGARAARILHQGGAPKMIDWLVLASYSADDAVRPRIERELEQLNVDTSVRKAILARAGIR